MRGRGLDPTTAVLVSLDVNAGRLASAMTPPRDAMAELREIGGDRTDLLAQAAGVMLGGVLGRSGRSRPDTLLAVGYLMLAGADPEATLVVAQATAEHVAAPLRGAGIIGATGISET